MKRTTLALVLLVSLLAVAWSFDPEPVEGSKPVTLESAGALTFGPPGVLFVGDPFGAQVVAYELEEKAHTPRELDLEGLDQRVASLLGTSVSRIQIHDLAVSPVSYDAYVTVSRGDTSGDARIKTAVQADRTPHLIRVTGEDELTEIDLTTLPATSARLSDVRPAGQTRWGHDRRSWNILEMKFMDGTLFVSGVSNEEWSSKMRRVEYPFRSSVEPSALRIFHTAHGRWETDAPARVFTPYERNGKKGILAGFSCTPLVDIALADLETRSKVEGRTIAELGPGNHVLDMISVSRDGKTYFLLANHLHPFMSLALDDFEGAKNLTRSTTRAGIDRHPLGPADVTRLANLGSDFVVMLQEPEDSGRVDLVTASVDELLGGRVAAGAPAGGSDSELTP